MSNQPNEIIVQTWLIADEEFPLSISEFDQVPL